MICIEFLATKRATGLGEAHISPHHLEKQHLTRSHSYACCNLHVACCTAGVRSGTSRRFVMTRKFGRYWRHTRPERAFSPDQLGRKCRVGPGNCTPSPSVG